MEKQTFLSPSIEPESIESLSQKLLEANLQLSNANRELEKLQQYLIEQVNMHALHIHHMVHIQ